MVQVPENRSFYTHVWDIDSRSPGSVTESLACEMPSCKGMPRATGVACSRMIMSENMPQTRDSSAQHRRPKTAEKWAAGTGRRRTYIKPNLGKISSAALQDVVR